MRLRFPDRWTTECTAAALLALLVVIVHGALPLTATGGGVPYAGGAAVILGAGAVLASAFGTRSPRLLVATGVLGLLLVRGVAALRPDVMGASHGPASTTDLVALALLTLVAALLVRAAARCPAADRVTAPFLGPVRG